MPSVNPINVGVAPEKLSAYTEKTGKIINKPSMRKDIMLESTNSMVLCFNVRALLSSKTRVYQKNSLPVFAFALPTLIVDNTRHANKTHLHARRTHAQFKKRQRRYSPRSTGCDYWIVRFRKIITRV